MDSTCEPLTVARASLVPENVHPTLTITAHTLGSAPATASGYKTASREAHINSPITDHNTHKICSVTVSASLKVSIYRAGPSLVDSKLSAHLRPTPHSTSISWARDFGSALSHLRVDERDAPPSSEDLSHQSSIGRVPAFHSMTSSRVSRGQYHASLAAPSGTFAALSS